MLEIKDFPMNSPVSISKCGLLFSLPFLSLPFRGPGSPAQDITAQAEWEGHPCNVGVRGCRWWWNTVTYRRIGQIINVLRIMEEAWFLTFGKENYKYGNGELEWNLQLDRNWTYECEIMFPNTEKYRNTSVEAVYTHDVCVHVWTCVCTHSQLLSMERT